MSDAVATHDLLIVGGGINGAGIARDAAGRGLSVLLCEQGDIAGATSSASSKMIHGGLRYLEHYEFRLVAEALAEREVMRRIAPHLTRPLRIVMPHVATQRPAWMIRMGLWLYDSLGRLRERTTLPGSTSVDLRLAPWGAPLDGRYRKGFIYSDVLNDDARLTLATVRAAANLGAEIRTRTRCVAARRESACWRVTLTQRGQTGEVSARALINAAGPWVAEVLAQCQTSPHGTHDTQNTHAPHQPGARLIKGSHIVVPRLYAGEHGWLLQNDDHRVIFLLPFEEKFTLIGTTEIKVPHVEAHPLASAEEIDYLCRAVARFFRHAPQPTDVVWSYAGLRPLYDDGHGQPADVTRDYTFLLDGREAQAPLLSIFGGKLTTHRRLAEAALEKISPWFPQQQTHTTWTATQALPGGDFANFDSLCDALCRSYPGLPADWLKSLARRHGSLVADVLGDARTVHDLGRGFGGGLYEREVDYFIRHEWAQAAEDILWRRSKAGLHMAADERDHFTHWFNALHPEFSSVVGDCP
ncbi:MAG: glycerol-3-phosphate dehydrogenase [Sterolibacterium sp.]|jgi:glycerol-3-phosphate dehydrogenase|nr:glycerol-3-phosphate dehydrogenase [Sterolibacterium sp.]